MPSIAIAYGINRAHAYQLRKRHGLTAEQLADPGLVFEKLLNAGRGCPLRKRLIDPAKREAIAEQINLAAIRGNAPSIEAKISSIK